MDIPSLARRHEAWRLRSCINLLASENITSPAVRRLLGSDFGHRYTLPLRSLVHGTYVENAYRGTRFTDEVEARTEASAREVFRCRYANVKALSGHLAGFTVLVTICKRGDLMLAVSPDDGGYDGYAPGFLPEILGLSSEPIPFDRNRWNLNAPRAAEVIRDRRPRLVLLGQSFFPFPYPLEPIAQACREAGAVLAYDGSHVLGLIAGGQFQDPLRQGTDVLFGSTHKSFFGPQGGIIMTDREDLMSSLGHNLVWRTLDNAHWNRIAALGEALSEMARHGRRYASQVVANARTLARSLADGGFPLRFADQGFTASHQIIVDAEGLHAKQGLTLNDFAVGLERCNIIVDAVGRLGTAEVTRMGAREGEMKTIASLILDHLGGGDVKMRVRELRKSLAMDYTLDRQG